MDGFAVLLWGNKPPVVANNAHSRRRCKKIEVNFIFLARLLLSLQKKE